MTVPRPVSVLPSVACMPAYTYERTCAVRYSPCPLIEKAECEVAKSVPCTDSSNMGSLIDIYLIDVR